MNLIRNGGFEEATLLYWQSVTAGSLVLDAPNSNRGSGCGKFTSSGVGLEHIRNMDYIEVDPYEILIVTGYVKSAAARTCKFYMFEYDEDLNEIGFCSVGEITTAVPYTMIRGEYVVPDQVRYVRLHPALSGSANGEIFYFDDIFVQRYQAVKGLYRQEEIADINNVNVSGDTSDDKRDKKGFTTYIADLHVRTITGTNPTLNVWIMEIDGNGDPVTVGTFAQKTAQGTERIALTNATGNQMYVDYVIGGTNPNIYFEVALTGKR